MRTQAKRRGFGFGVLACLAGCAASPFGSRSLQEGDYGRLHAELVRAEGRGSVTLAHARDLARRVATQALETAPPADALARVREARACAGELDAPLARLMDRPGEAAGEAAMARLEAGGLSLGAARRYVQSASDRFRAVGVRALVEGGDCGARAAALLDPAPQVRRAAAHASRAASSRCSPEGDASRELGALLDAARVDPDLLIRNDAVRALPAVLARSRDEGPPETVVRALGDLWEDADDPLRDEIARAYAAPHLYEAGGRDRLARLVAMQGAAGGVEAAFAILTLRPRGAARDGEAALEGSAVAFLVHAIREGSRREKLEAIALAPLTPPRRDLVAALHDAASDSDSDVAFAARSRLTESEPFRAASLAELEVLARPDAPPGQKARARFALAAAGDLRVQAWLEADLARGDDADLAPGTQAVDNERKLAAARGLAALGRPNGPPRCSPNGRRPCGSAPPVRSSSPGACIVDTRFPTTLEGSP